MIKAIYSLYDKKSKLYGNTFTSVNDGTAIREMQQAVSSEGSIIQKYPSDYALFKISEWDDESGMIKSRFVVTLFVFDIPITGIPAFVASTIACPSTSGSEIMISCGSMKYGNEGLVNVPGINLLSIGVVPVSSINFSIGVVAYSFPEQTITFFISNRVANFAALFILASVMSISII